VQAKVQAYNSRGWGDLSSANLLGALAEVVPVAMYSPMNGLLTTETELDITWLALTTQSERGGSTCIILSYNLVWDQGTGTSWSELTGVTSLYTLTEFI
jgi:hypothetical protein